MFWGLSSVGRAPTSHVGGQGFDSPRLHGNTTKFHLNKRYPLIYPFAEQSGVLATLSR